MIVKMFMFWLAETYIISHYNHPTRGDHNTAAPILKMSVVWFVVVSQEITNKMKENTVVISCAFILNKKKTLSKVKVKNKLPSYGRYVASLLDKKRLRFPRKVI